MKVKNKNMEPLKLCGCGRGEVVPRGAVRVHQRGRII